MNIKLHIQEHISSSEAASCFVMRFFQLINCHKYKIAKNQSNSRGLFELTEGAFAFPYYPRHPIVENNHYGHVDVLAAYCQSIPISKVYIEHGLYFGGHLQYNQKTQYANKVITFSKRRGKHIDSECFGKKSYPIGPYIRYSQGVLDNKLISQIKYSLGKTLLFFFSHSTKYDQAAVGDIEFDIIFHSMDKIGIEFETKMVCLYYMDLLNNEIVNKFQSNGYIVVSAGHKFDPMFLDNLKTLIQISDYTASNSVGTHIGYCLSLNKCHYLSSDAAYETKNEIMNKLYGKYYEEGSKEREHIYSAFREPNSYTTDQQICVFNEYWGGDIFKSQIEISQILTEPL